MKLLARIVSVIIGLVMLVLFIMSIATISILGGWQAFVIGASCSLVLDIIVVFFIIVYTYGWEDKGE